MKCQEDNKFYMMFFPLTTHESVLTSSEHFEISLEFFLNHTFKVRIFCRIKLNCKRTSGSLSFSQMLRARAGILALVIFRDSMTSDICDVVLCLESCCWL